jgi:hypothetical protein
MSSRRPEEKLPSLREQIEDTSINSQLAYADWGLGESRDSFQPTKMFEVTEKAIIECIEEDIELYRHVHVQSVNSPEDLDPQKRQGMLLH